MSDKCLVTGCAGFIGSHIAERLLAQGYDVLGVDCFTDYYARAIKEANLAASLRKPGFRFIQADLCNADLGPLLQGVGYVFHEAAQAGVRSSWGSRFHVYTNHNILATQRLLEACRGSGIRKFVFASSSSVYGNTRALPMREDAPLRPYSPYGVTKLAAEHLCQLYHDNWGVPVIALRYFTVYGPRQRPDMAFNRFIRAILRGEPLTLYGDGAQTRDFTYVDDIVEANMLAMQADLSGRTFNIGGGSRVTVANVIELIGQALGQQPIIRRLARQAGDARHTWADTTAAQEALGFCPQVTLEEGLAAEAAWIRGAWGLLGTS